MPDPRTVEAFDDDGDALRELSALEDLYSHASVGDLAAPSQNPPEKSIAARIDDEKLEELKDARTYRKRIVTFTLVTVGGLVFASTGFMVAYMISQWDEIEAAVMISFFTALVVESIGILYVISRYLFPHSGPHHDPGSSDAG